ncbi:MULTISPECIES: cell division protein ZapE [Cysteiniphilum]|uniref:cell division protein ZapE n=1 Tax=Cysteiniphilum TaxID=2056696 RepID=UPI00177D8B13|nr:MULTISPECIES: cell division protein ZapE [Cysteiniphilum]
MTLRDSYLNYLNAHHYNEDSLQLQAIDYLQQIIARVKEQDSIKSKTWRLFKKKPDPIKGLYMWGGVGRGKTFIMDLFYDTLTIDNKTRLHFNHFMQQVHQSLRNFQGQNNPLQKVAHNIADQYSVICFDEFFVEDIADAMILGGLFTQLFELGITLIATSNIPPERLYQGGLQRELFLPAIDCLIKHVTVLNLDSGTDYRQLTQSHNQNFFYPLPEATLDLANRFKQSASTHVIYDTEIILEDRLVKVKAVDEHAIWFDFFSICGDGRGVSDYIALAKRFDTIYISDMPILTIKHESESRRFIAMIDEFYDEDKHVIIAAETDFNDIYQGEKLKFEFERTKSRLHEMQQQHQ